MGILATSEQSAKNSAEQTAAAVIARFLKQRGVDRVFGLCGDRKSVV